jgi:hypothetical protein
VKSPAAAREVIASGKLAVVLGIETSNLFDCFLSPRPGYPKCDEAMVRARLQSFVDAGTTDISVRVVPIGENRDELLASMARTREFLAALVNDLAGK